MRETTSKLNIKIKEISSNVGKWVSINWYFYSFWRTIILLPISFMAFLTLLFLNWLAFLVVAAMAFILSLLFMFLDRTKSIVAKTNPEFFVITEKWEGWVEKAFLVFAVSFIGVFFFIGVKTQLVGYEQIVDYVLTAFALVSVFASSTFLPFLVNLLEYLFPSYYISECLRASARISVVLNALSKNPDVKTIREVMPLFRGTLNIYNNHLVEVFDFAIRDPDRFYKYVRLTALSHDQDNLTKVKDGLTNLATILEQKVEDPFKFVIAIRTMTGESENKPRDLFEEIEIEPHFRKWVKDHSELLKLLITASIALIGSIILPLVLKFLIKP